MDSFDDFDNDTDDEDSNTYNGTNNNKKIQEITNCSSNITNNTSNITRKSILKNPTTNLYNSKKTKCKVKDNSDNECGERNNNRQVRITRNTLRNTQPIKSVKQKNLRMRSKSRSRTPSTNKKNKDGIVTLDTESAVREARLILKRHSQTQRHSLKERSPSESPRKKILRNAFPPKHSTHYQQHYDDDDEWANDSNNTDRCENQNEVSDSCQQFKESTVNYKQPEYQCKREQHEKQHKQRSAIANQKCSKLRSTHGSNSTNTSIINVNITMT